MQKINTADGPLFSEMALNIFGDDRGLANVGVSEQHNFYLLLSCFLIHL